MLDKFLHINKGRVIVLLLMLMVAPLNSVFAGDVFHGKEIYTRYCAGCHGSSGEGLMPGMPDFTQGERLLRTDRDLIDSVRIGNGVMPAFNGMLTDDEIENVVAYLRSFL